MSAFRITAYLDTPLALGTTYLTLDAVLFGILSDLKELGVSDADPIESIPLDQREGLFLASRAFFLDPVETTETKIGGIRPVKDMADATATIRPARGTKLAKVVTTRGDTKAHLSRYRSIACEGVYWLAEGDPEKAAALLRAAGSVGALRKDGHGQISHVEIEEDAGETALIDALGEVTRPIPVEIATALGLNSRSNTTIDTWRPPYWDRAAQADCLVPPRS